MLPAFTSRTRVLPAHTVLCPRWPGRGASCSRPASSYNLCTSKSGLRIVFPPPPEGRPLSHVKVQRTHLNPNLETRGFKVSGGVGGTLTSGAPRSRAGRPG